LTATQALHIQVNGTDNHTAGNWQLSLNFSDSTRGSGKSQVLVIGTGSSSTDLTDATDVVCNPYNMDCSTVALLDDPTSANPVEFIQDLRAPITTGMKIWRGGILNSTDYVDAVTWIQLEFQPATMLALSAVPILST